jgi:hypothetical protein
MIKSADTMVVSYRPSSGPAIARFIQDDSGDHLHLDFAKKEVFDKKNTPKATHKRVELDVLLRGVQGTKINVGIIGVYFLALDDIPKDVAIRSLSGEISGGDTSVRLTAGELSFEKAPLESIDWRLVDDDKVAIVTVTSKKREEINEDYLERIGKWIDDLFDVFVLRKGADA